MTKQDVLTYLREHKAEFYERFGVLRIGLFGSYARGDADEESDIDLVVEMQRSQKAEHYFALLHLLEDDLNKKIDLGTDKALKPALLDAIRNEIIYV